MMKESAMLGIDNNNLEVAIEALEKTKTCLQIIFFKQSYYHASGTGEDGSPSGDGGGLSNFSFGSRL